MDAVQQSDGEHTQLVGVTDGPAVFGVNGKCGMGSVVYSCVVYVSAFHVELDGRRLVQICLVMSNVTWPFVFTFLRLHLFMHTVEQFDGEHTQLVGVTDGPDAFGVSCKCGVCSVVYSCVVYISA
jgi:hypothetical protein